MSAGHDDLDDERRLLDEASRVSRDGVVDARGLRCPAPIILLARAARDAAGAGSGAGAGSETETVLEVWWTDPAAETDIGAWARMRGHQVLGTEPLARSDAAAGAVPAAGEASGEPPAFATRVQVNCP